MASFRDFGNDLYSGKRSINFVGRRKTWYLVAIVVVLLAILAPILRGGFSFGIEFTGGSEFRIDGVSSQGETVATEVVDDLFPGADSVVNTVGVDSIRVQTEQLEDVESEELRLALADAYGVQSGEVASSFIGPNWGADVTNQAIQGLVVFLILVSLLMPISMVK